MVKIRKNVALAPFTTFRVGGPARYFATVKTEPELREALAFARTKGVPYFILGGGSNILVPDDGFPGLVVKLAVKDTQWTKEGSVTAGAGLSWDKLVGLAVSRGLSGVENLSLIPGTVGGAVYQNIGAYGAELKDVLLNARVFNTATGEVLTLSREQCGFGYRDSIFKHDRGRHFIILSAIFKLSKRFNANLGYPDLAKNFENRTPTLAAVRRAVISIRRRKLVYPAGRTGSAGSFFENPVVSTAFFKKLSGRFPELKHFPTDVPFDVDRQKLEQFKVKLSAGQLIELAGFKGKRRGNVGVSEKHALVLVNYGGGSATALTALAGDILEAVDAKFGIRLKPEVQVLGY